MDKMTFDEFAIRFLNAEAETQIIIDRLLHLSRDKKSEVAELIRNNEGREINEVLKEYFGI